MTGESGELLPFDSRQVICDLPEYSIQLKLFILQLNGSLFIWIGDEENKLSGLSVCLPSRSVISTQHHSTTIYSANGASSNPFSEYEENLSCKISKRYNCPVFVSISLPYEFVALWNNVNLTTGNTFGQEAERHLFKNLPTFISSR
ncbi:unnamed protein product [Heterobilharzia americana]|nr:unnamed protein product [Heterobilharzia americana]